MIFFDPIYIASILFASIVYWSFIPDRFRLYFVIIGSFSVLFSIQPVLALALTVALILTFKFSKILAKNRSFNALTGYIVAVVFVLLLLKYLQTLAFLFPKTNVLLDTYIVPLGISYIAFKLIAFTIDVYRGYITQPSLRELLAFVLFIPMFSAGPIEKYQNFANKREPFFKAELYIEGLQRLILGYAKKIIVVDFILNETIFKGLYPSLEVAGFSVDSPWVALSFMAGALLYAYFDLSAYADLAIGFGLLFGYRICENMKFPIIQKNLSLFWNCWHISLSNWCRDNIYFPVLGKTRNSVIALYSSFFVMGMWHNISLNWLAWGAWHATGLVIFTRWTRYLKKVEHFPIAIPESLRNTLGIVVTFLYVSIGYSFVMTHSIGQAISLIGSLNPISF